jgi:hypothetical protein
MRIEDGRIVEVREFNETCSPSTTSDLSVDRAVRAGMRPAT